MLYITFAALPLLSMGSPQSVLLRYKFAPGSSHTYSIKINVNMKIGMGSQTMPMNVASDATVRMTVNKVANGVADITSEVLKQSSTTNGRTSNAPKSSSHVRMTVKGESKGMQIAQPVNSPMDMSSLQSLQSGNILPEGPARVGSSWHSPVSLGKGSAANMTSHLDKIGQSGGNTLAYISVKGTADVASLFGAMLSKIPGGVKADGTMKFDIHYVFNATKGMIQSQNSNTTYAMKMRLQKPPKGSPGNMNMAGGQTMTMQIIG
jgi:hypothetical protein